MNITITPTPELYEAPINGVKVPVRIWSGVTSEGVRIEAYVLSITPSNASEHGQLQLSLPNFMRRSSDMFQIDTGE